MMTLIWPNGEMTTGKTYLELEDAMRAAQWRTFESRRAFREEMCARALLWSDTIVKDVRSSKEMILALRDADMFMKFPD